MSATNPGLSPKGNINAQKVSINVESSRLSELPTEQNKAEVLPTAESQVTENTVATEPEVKSDTKSVEEAPAKSIEDREFSERASKRFQELANRTAKAEAEARAANEMLRRVVGAQVTPPAPSQEEMLAKQFKTYDPSLKYPTDPNEYIRFTEIKSTLAARQEFMRVAEERERQNELNDLVKAYPNVVNEPRIQGAIAAEVTEAKKRGIKMSYKEAADIVYEDFKGKGTKAAINITQKDILEKNEAYVETTKGASVQRGPDVIPNPSKMTLKEMENYLKSQGQWD
jgi:hypothetical protein